VATKKDLVEAQAFSRRRLTTAFVAGAPGGREVEPQRPLRAIVGGIAVTVLLGVGGLVGGALKPGLPSGWDDNHLVIAKKSGARYVAIKKTLYPVINTTSARLLIPAGSFAVVTVNDDKIATAPRGAAIGILGAPDSLTPSERLARTGWVSCLSQSGGVKSVVGRGPSTSSPATSGATVVKTADGLFVVTGSYRLPVTGSDAAAVLRQLRLDAATPIPAPAAWTSLFPQGPTLGALRVADAGKSLPGLPTGAVVGSVLAVKDSGAEPRRYVVTGSGELALMSPFAYALYQVGRTTGADLEVTPAEIAALKTTDRSIVPSQWPEQIPSALDGLPCATLTAGPNKMPVTSLSTAPLVKVGDGQSTEVEPGTGALVRAIGDNIINRGPVLVIDQTATSYSVVGGDDVLARLGYTKDDVIPVPQAWVGLFSSGPTLSVAAAQGAITASGTT
jgi:type VII secretion protein EccB